MKMGKLYYELVDFHRLYDRLIGYLGLKKSIEKAVSIEFPKKHHYRYKQNGMPITPEELEALNTYIEKYLKVPRESIEALAVRTFILGKIISNAEEARKSRKIFLASIPRNLKVAARRYNLSNIEIASIKSAEAMAAENITKITEQARKTVVSVILDAVKKRKHPKKLAQELFSEIVDSESNLNRDWQRVAVTEAGEISNNGFIATQPDESYVIGWSFPDACNFCKEHINGVVLKVSKYPVDDYSEFPVKSPRYQRLAKKWENEIWVGKNNVGRSVHKRKVGPEGKLIPREHHELSQPAVVAHPWCRQLSVVRL
jgi:hypothetical protein